MVINLLTEYNLRGYAFEYIMKIMLRRTRKNNFIFQTNQFDGIDEICKKYRLDGSEVIDAIDALRLDKMRCDLIEFELDDVVHRKIKKIGIFDVKTSFTRSSSTNSMLQTCVSGSKFMERMKMPHVQRSIVAVTLYADWKFRFDIQEYDDVPLDVYTRFSARTSEASSDE